MINRPAIVNLPLAGNRGAIAAYVDALEAMLGDFAGPEMLLTVAAQHEVCAEWCAKSGRPGRAEVFRAAAAMIRERCGLMAAG